MVKRIALLIVTNLAVLFLLSMVLRLLGLDRIPIGPGGLDYKSLLVMSAVMGFGGSFISLAISKWMAKMSTGAKVITQPRNETEAWLLQAVERMSNQVGIRMPEVAIFPSPDMNAFATGMSRNSSLVAVSTGLLQNMSRAEAEAVIGHEVSHVANGDMVTLTLLQGVLNTFVIFLSRVVGYLVDQALSQNDREERRGTGPGFFITTMVCQIVFGILASLIVAWYSRQREFRADAGGGQLTHPSQMIGALEELKRAHTPGMLPESMAAMGIRSSKGGLFALFASHPPLEDRIAALRTGN